MFMTRGLVRPMALMAAVPSQYRHQVDEARTLLHYLIENGDIVPRRKGAVFVATLTIEAELSLAAFEAELHDLEPEEPEVASR